MTGFYDDADNVPDGGATIDVVARLRWHAAETDSPLLAGDLDEAARLIVALRRTLDEIGWPIP